MDVEVHVVVNKVDEVQRMVVEGIRTPKLRGTLPIRELRRTMGNNVVTTTTKVISKGVSRMAKLITALLQNNVHLRLEMVANLSNKFLLQEDFVIKCFFKDVL